MSDFEQRARLSSIVNNYFSGRNGEVESALKKLGRPVSLRTIQAWRMEPNSKSSRKIPSWVIPSLEKYIFDEKNKPYIGKDYIPHSDFKNNNEFSEWIFDQKIVSYAERQIKEDENIKCKWSNAKINEIPSILADLEMFINRELESLINWRYELQNAINESDDLKSLKRNLTERLNIKSNIRWEVKLARKAIEDNSEEFADPEGLLDSNRDKNEA
jgi:hypothetical protein